MSNSVFQKLPSSIKPFDVDPVSTVEKNLIGEVETAIPSNKPFTKGVSVKLPHAFIFVIAGGKKTEKNYFSIITDREDVLKSLRFIYQCDDTYYKDGVPKVFSLAYSKQDFYRLSEDSSKPDSYYIVTDVDTFIKPILENLPKCKERGINLIISNPCFEVWTYYSKFSDKFVAFTPSGDTGKLSSELKEYVHKSTPIGIPEKRAIFDIEKNIVNSRNNYDECPEGIPNLYSTNMHILAEVLVPHIKEYLETLKTKQRLKQDRQK